MQSIQLADFDRDALRTRLRKMSDEELREFGKAARYMSLSWATWATRGQNDPGLFTAISVQCPENLDLGLFTEQTCYMLSAKMLVSEMLARRYPRGTAGHAVSVAPKKLARTFILILGTLGLNFVGQG